MSVHRTLGLVRGVVASSFSPRTTSVIGAVPSAGEASVESSAAGGDIYKAASAAKAAAPKASGEQADVIISPAFKMVFIVVVVLTVIGGIGAVILSFVEGVNPNQQAVFDTMNSTWKLGLGAIFGLLSGKTV